MVWSMYAAILIRGPTENPEIPQNPRKSPRRLVWFSLVFGVAISWYMTKMETRERRKCAVMKLVYSWMAAPMVAPPTPRATVE